MKIIEFSQILLGRKARFLYVQLLILAGVVWLMWPLRQTTELPNPPYPAYTPEPPARQATLLLCPDVLSPDTQASARVVVYDPDRNRPLSGAQVRVSLQSSAQPTPVPLVSTETDELGSAPIRFAVPTDAAGEYQLEFEIDSPIGEQRATCPVRIEQGFRLDMTTDRLTYAPGETIHIHLLAFEQTFGHLAADLPIRFEVYDPRGHRICAESAVTSAYGLALADCVLGAMVYEGEYRVVAAAEGLPLYVEQRVGLSRQGTDKQRESRQDEGRPVAEKGNRPTILISAMAESDTLEPEIENIVYLRARYADDTPAACDLELITPDGSLVLTADAQGEAVWRVTPAVGTPITLTVTARDHQGRTGQAVLSLPVEGGAHGFLVRPDRLAYHGGEAMHVEVVSSWPLESVYLDLIWNGQPVAALAAPAVRCADDCAHGRAQRRAVWYAEFEPVLDPTWIGDLVLRGYTLNGEIIADVRAVTVLPSDAPTISAQAGQAVYEVGDQARLSVQVRDGPQGVPALLALSVRGATEESPIWELPDQAMERSQRGYTAPGVAATPQLIGVISRPRAMPEEVRRRFAEVDAARAARQSALSALTARWLWGLSGLAALGWLVLLVDGLRRRHLRGSGFLLSGPLVLALSAVAGPLLAYGGQQLFGPGAWIVLALGWLGALLALLVYGWTHDDGAAQVVVALLIGGLALGWGIQSLATQCDRPLCGVLSADTSPGMRWVGAGAIGAAILSLYLLGLLVRRRSGLLIALGLVAMTAVSVGSVLLTVTSPVETAQATPSPTPTVVPTLADAPGRTPFSASGTRARTVSLSPTQPRFVTTRLWQAGLLTDRQGRAEITLPLPAEAVNWTVDLLAVTGDGRMAMAEVPLRSVDPLPATMAMPKSMTIGDRFDVPVVLQNTTGVTQTAGMTVSVSEWARIERRAEAQKVEVGAGEQVTLTVPLQVRGWGEQTLSVTAWVGAAQEVLTRNVSVLPDGKPTLRTYNRLTGETDTYKIRIPWSSLRGADRIVFYVDSTWAGVLTRGLNGALRHLDLGTWYMPTVVTPTQMTAMIGYPQAFDGNSLTQIIAEIDNVLLLYDYLSRSGRLTPAMEETIVRYARERYQHLLTFEAAEGGFADLPGQTATLAETAAALHGLTRLSALTPVDPQTLDRVARWLLDRQEANGIWRPERMPPGWERLPRPELACTAQVSRALAEAGYPNDKAFDMLAKYQDLAQEPYTLAMVVHALVSYQERVGGDVPALAQARARLLDMARVENEVALWHGTLALPDGAVGEAADLEQTALALWALIRAGSEAGEIRQGLLALAQGRDAWGTWGAPQTTAWALQALEAAVEAQIANPTVNEARVQASTVSLADREARKDTPLVVIPTTDTEMSYVFYLDAPPKGYNDVRLTVAGGPVLYQLVAEYVEGWAQVPPPSPEEEAVAMTLSYERTTLQVGETTWVTVSVALNRSGTARLVELNLGLPPGLEPVAEDWAAMMPDPVIGYALGDTAIRVYLSDLTAGRPLILAYRLRARYPSQTRTLPVWAIEVANPQQPTFREPTVIEVRP